MLCDGMVMILGDCCIILGNAGKNCMWYDIRLSYLVSYKGGTWTP